MHVRVVVSCLALPFVRLAGRRCVETLREHAAVGLRVFGRKNMIKRHSSLQQKALRMAMTLLQAAGLAFSL